MNTMIQTMESMCVEIQNCLFAYCQSDEITFFLKDYQNLNTSAWFEYRTDKLCSISSSLATYYFNKYFNENAKHFIAISDNEEYITNLLNCLNKLAVFDSRCFNIPKEEVINCFYWRQLDAVRNSIQACGQAYFSHKQLEYKSCENIKQMLIGANHPWENVPIYKQRGTCCRREGKEWITDYSMPLLVKEGREYLEPLI